MWYKVFQTGCLSDPGKDASDRGKHECRRTRDARYSYTTAITQPNAQHWRHTGPTIYRCDTHTTASRDGLAGAPSGQPGAEVCDEHLQLVL
jgi:hypothetical protein